MMDVVDEPVPTKLTNLADPASFQSTTTISKLPATYRPRPRDVCCGRGKRNWTHAGNILFRKFIHANVDRYIEASSSRDKTTAVRSIVDQLREEGSYFVRMDDSGSWYDIGDFQAREKVGHSLRDQVMAMKKGEKKKNAAAATATPAATPASSPLRYATPAVVNSMSAPAAVTLANPPMLNSIEMTSSEVAAASRGNPMPMASGLRALSSLNYPQANNFAQQGAFSQMTDTSNAHQLFANRFLQTTDSSNARRLFANRFSQTTDSSNDHRLFANRFPQTTDTSNAHRLLANRFSQTTDNSNDHRLSANRFSHMTDSSNDHRLSAVRLTSLDRSITDDVSKLDSASMEDHWITLDEAQDRVPGKVKWWKAQGPAGRRVEERQHRSNGPDDKPVYLFPGGHMYIGEWNADQTEEQGFGVYCDPKMGGLYAGLWDGGALTSGSDLYLPGSTTWMTNRDNYSPIKSLPPRNTKKAVHGLPFVYFGCWKDGARDDPHALVILKDGTTRIGPWKKNKPVGDWWKDHAKRTATPEELAKLLSFTESQQQEGVVVKPEASSDEHQEDSDGTTRKRIKRTKKRHQEQILSITEWLMQDNVIGRDALADDMEEYARELRKLGLHSVAMIKEICTLADVDEQFDWMPFFHKRLFKKCLGLLNDSE